MYARRSRLSYEARQTFFKQGLSGAGLETQKRLSVVQEVALGELRQDLVKTALFKIDGVERAGESLGRHGSLLPGRWGRWRDPTRSDALPLIAAKS